MDEERMKRLSLALMLPWFLLGSAWSQGPVHFPDPSLKAAVEEALWISDPTPVDMLGLTRLAVIAEGITDLTGLEYATNLQTLILSNNKNISDISVLAGLGNLETLMVNQNQIDDVSALSGLNNLRHLDIHHNRITDISVLSALHDLQRLSLHENPISDISVLAGLSRLRELRLLDTQVSDISALANLTSLEQLDLRGNLLNEEGCDVYIPQIIANNPGIVLLHDCAPLSLSVSSTAGGTVAHPGEGQFRYNYEDGEFVVLEAEADPGFVFIGWSGSHSSAENPTFVPLNQDHQIRANFLSILEVIYVDDDAPDDPGPEDSIESDPNENGTPEHPLDTIQEAIDVAANGVSVIVRPGVYRENIDFLGKNIQLMGIDPIHPNRTAYPVIEGSDGGPVVSFTAGEDPNCLLMGFVIRRGTGRPGAAITCSGSSPTVTNCLIVGNRSTDPNAAAVYCNDSKTVFAFCTIADNGGGKQGAGVVLVDSNVTVTNAILWGNTPQEILLAGSSEPSITYTDIASGWPDLGNIDEDPLFAKAGRWTAQNSPNIVVGPDEPRAAWIEGDYHLKSHTGRWDPEIGNWVWEHATSPCIDAGDPRNPVGHEPLPNGGIVNMGAYGGTDVASKSGPK